MKNIHGQSKDCEFCGASEYCIEYDEPSGEYVVVCRNCDTVAGVLS